MFRDRYKKPEWAVVGTHIIIVVIICIIIIIIINVMNIINIIMNIIIIPIYLFLLLIVFIYFSGYGCRPSNHVFLSARGTHLCLRRVSIWNLLGCKMWSLSNGRLSPSTNDVLRREAYISTSASQHFCGVKCGLYRTGARHPRPTMSSDVKHTLVSLLLNTFVACGSIS